MGAAMIPCVSSLYEVDLLALNGYRKMPERRRHKFRILQAQSALMAWLVQYTSLQTSLISLHVRSVRLRESLIRLSRPLFVTHHNYE